MICLRRRNVAFSSALIYVSLVAGVPTGVAQRPPVEADVESAGILARVRLRGSGALLPDGRCSECVTAIFLVTDPRRTSEWEQTLSRAGATIGFSNATIGYVRADLSVRLWNSVRTSALLATAQLSGEASVRDTLFEDEIVWTGPSASSPATPGAPMPDGASDPERAYPELPVDRFRDLDVSVRPDVGVDTWLRDHPSWDGRGVTIGFVGDVLGLEHPLLKDGYTLDGTSTSKIRARIASTDSRAIRVRGASPFADVLSEHRSVGNVIQANGRTYRLPGPGTYSLGLWRTDERVYDVLIDWRHRVAWIDTKGIRDFAEAPALRDANESDDSILLRSGGARIIAIFEPGGARSLRFVTLRAGHDSMVVTAAAGNDGQARLIGMAPGASAILVESGTLLHTLLEAHIVAASDPRVDIVSESTSNQGVETGGWTLRSQVLDRLSRAYGKVTFISAGNGGPAFRSMAGGDGDEPIYVGAYASGRVLRGITGLPLPNVDFVLPYSSRGPRQDGVLKPEIVAPAAQIVGRCAGRTWRVGAFRLPACYSVSEGTSTAAPTAAGLAALLVSAARQNGIPTTAADLRFALLSGARSLAEWSVLEQGWGVINVHGAWNVMRRSRAPGPAAGPSASERRRTDETTHSIRREPGEIVAYEGATGAACHTERIHLSRADLPSGRNDDITIEVHHDATSAINTAPKGTVLSWPKAAGVHSVPITLCPIAPGTHTVAVVARSVATQERLMLRGVLVTVPFGLDRHADELRMTTSAEVPFMRHAEVPIRIPADLAYMEVRATVSAGAIRLRLHEPSAMSVLYRQPANRQDQIARMLPVGTHVIRLVRPRAGTWTIAMVNDNNIDQSFKAPPIPAHVSLEILAFDARTDITTHVLRAEQDRVAPTANRLTAGLSWELTRGELNDVQIAWNRDWQLYEPAAIVLPRDVVRLRIEARSDSNVTSYLFKCTSGICIVHDTNLEGGNSHVYDVDRPAEGRWVLMAGRTTWTAQAPPFEARIIRLTGAAVARSDATRTYTSASPPWSRVELAASERLWLTLLTPRSDPVGNATSGFVPLYVGEVDRRKHVR